MLADPSQERMNTWTCRSLFSEVEQQIEVKAPVAAAFEGLICQLTQINEMPLKLERFPGGAGSAIWAATPAICGVSCRLIKPTLLEIQGPMMMSYPVAGHVQFRLSEVAGGTKVTVRHCAMGLIEDAHREGVSKGWLQILSGIQGDST